MRLMVVVLCAVVGLVLSDYPDSTENLVETLLVSNDEIITNRQCVEEVGGVLEIAINYIETIGEIKDYMESIRDNSERLGAALKFLMSVPGIDREKRNIKAIIVKFYSNFEKYFQLIGKVDRRIHSLKERLEYAVISSYVANDALRVLSDACTSGVTRVLDAQECVNKKTTGRQRELGKYLEKFSDAVNPRLDQLRNAIGNVRSSCEEIQSVMNLIKRWPKIRPILTAVKEFKNSFKPLSKFVEKLPKLLYSKLCPPGSKVCHPVSIQRILLNRENPRTNDLMQLAAEKVKGILNEIPSTKLPGLGEMDPLYGIDIDIEVPYIDFEIDSELVEVFREIDWSCAYEVGSICAADVKDVKIQCDLPISSFNDQIHV